MVITPAPSRKEKEKAEKDKRGKDKGQREDCVETWKVRRRKGTERGGGKEGIGR